MGMGLMVEKLSLNVGGFVEFHGSKVDHPIKAKVKSIAKLAVTPRYCSSRT